MGCENVPFPPRPLDSENLEQDSGGGDRGNSDLPPLAEQPVVVDGGGPSPGPTPAPPSLQGDPNTSAGEHRGLFGAARGNSHFWESLATSCNNFDLTDDEIIFISHQVSAGSANGYGFGWKRFINFCSDLEADPNNCPVNFIVKYLKKLFDNGAMYHTVNFAHSAISKIHTGFSGTPAGQHSLVKKVVQACFRLRPPLPRYKTTYDVGIILKYVKIILGNNDYLSIKLLSCKCLFLLSFYSLSRVNTSSKLGTNFEEHQEHLVIPLLSLEKQARGLIMNLNILSKNLCF